MDTVHEIIPFAKEMLSQRPSRGMLRLYVVGSVVAVLGTVLGLVETLCQVCQPFCTDEPMDAELAVLLAREQRALEAQERRQERDMVTAEATEEVIIPKQERRDSLAQRNAANRLHASQ